jgi:hypothetical protein
MTVMMTIMITMTTIKILIINARTECPVTAVSVFKADVRDISTVTGNNYTNWQQNYLQRISLPTAHSWKYNNRFNFNICRIVLRK